MQSNDGASGIQQLMVEGEFSALFSISTADMNSSPQPQKHHPHAHQLPQQQQHHLQQPRQQYHHQHQQVQRQHRHNEHPHFHHQHLAPQIPPQPLVSPSAQPLPFPQFPVTQQLFQQTHQFHLFQQEQQQRRMPPQEVHLVQDKSPVNSGSPARIVLLPASGGGVAGGGAGVPPFLARVNFNLDVNESTRGGDGLEEDEDAVQCDEGSESRLHPWSTGDEKSASKEPFWRPLDVDYINRNSKRGTEKLVERSDGSDDPRISINVNNADDGRDAANNYKLFSELEAICRPGSSGGGGGSSFGGGNGYHKSAASFFALVDTNPPPTVVAKKPELRPVREPCTVHAADQGSNASSEEEAAHAAPKSNKSSGGGGGTSRKRKRKQQLSSVARFLESLVRRLMEHQEGLHRKFLEVLERRDEERMNREEMWRQHETAEASREATARAQEQALASTREAAIISFLEKITGERLNLPTITQFQKDLQQKETTLEHLEQSVAQTAATGGGGSAVDGGATTADNQGLVSGNRWRKAEAQALIRVRSNLERRFQEPGLRGPLWEEVSAAMVAMGYHRSGKRCKEKWENINKYFRRSKDTAKERPRESKTCPYFQHLDQLYSKTTTGAPSPASAVPATTLHNAANVVSSSQTETFDQLRGMDPTQLGLPDRPEEDDKDDENEASHIGTVRRRGLSQAENDGGVFDEQEEEEGDRGRGRRRRGRRSGGPRRRSQVLKPHDGRQEIEPRRGAHR